MKLKAFAVAALMLSAALGAQQSPAGRIPLDKGGKFEPTDSPKYAEPGLNDSDWKPIKVDQDWDEQGHKGLTGFAWYRLRFTLPVGLRDSSKVKETLIFAMGRIDDGDQVFLNGEFLGQNGRTYGPGTAPPVGFNTGPWNLFREYAIPLGDPRIKWGKENVLAVRVVNGSGPGGMFDGGQHVRMLGMPDLIDFRAEGTPFRFFGQEVAKEFDIVNISDKLKMQGTLTIEVVGSLSGKVLTKSTRAINLAPKEKMPVIVQLGLNEESCRVNYHVAFKDGDTFSYWEESPYILTPPISITPKINGASVVGARPGKPFLFTVAASGERPMAFSATGLPDGLVINPQTGIITGTTPPKGNYTVKVTARNINGTVSRDLTIVSGDKLALTPPMGWNSWNVWGLAVDEEKVVASAKSFVDKGLRDFGWAYINIDDGWQIVGSSSDLKRDGNGNIIVNSKFPDMARLGRRIHELGLKFGTYSSPGPLTCGGYTGSYQHEQNDANSYASWGIDYLKYDWCSYGRIAKDNSLSELKKPYEIMRDALAKVDRDIVLSLCQYGMGDVWEWGESVGGQLWRTTGDIDDTWQSMSTIGFSQVKNAPYVKPGAWNDPDMLVLGWVGWGPNLRPTRLTPDEQYTHMSLWCLLSSPLLLGCDLTRLDPFTLNLLTNGEVLAINQDPLGKQATPKVVVGQIQVWVKDLSDGGKAIGVFNLGDKAADYELNLRTLGAQGKKLRDLWRQRDIGPLPEKHKVRVAPHGVVLIKAL